MAEDFERSRILVVDDEQSMREFLSIMLSKEGFRVDTASNGDEACRLFANGERYACVVTDLQMPGKSGLDVLEAARAADPSQQVIVITAHATPETAISSIRLGAYDYLIKPFKLDHARVVINRAIEKHALLSENLFLRSELGARPQVANIIGNSEAMRRVFDLIARVAKTKTTILITGESGTGKELVARAIHESGPLTGPFVPLNCGAIPESLIESELFGYKKGAFTGATQDRIGIIEAARGGTVFLDEIGELPLPAQVRLLRVLQEKKVKHVGGVEEISVDCRVIAATNRDLRAEVEAGRFREDLFYRLSIIPIELPPLRKRSGDIPLLLEHFLKHYADEIGNPIEGISRDALKVLLDYGYPGNVRELQNILERAVTLETQPMISVDVLPAFVREAHPSAAPATMDLPATGVQLDDVLAGLEHRLLSQALERTGGNKTDAAKLLGISFRSLRYRLKKSGLDDDESESLDINEG
ncbi:MAG: sigma-54 dependent transcriptional regulator [bacterium]